MSSPKNCGNFLAQIIQKCQIIKRNIDSQIVDTIHFQRLAANNDILEDDGRRKNDRNDEIIEQRIYIQRRLLNFIIPIECWIFILLEKKKCGNFLVVLEKSQVFCESLHFVVVRNLRFHSNFQ